MAWSLTGKSADIEVHFHTFKLMHQFEIYLSMYHIIGEAGLYASLAIVGKVEEFGICANDAGNASLLLLWLDRVRLFDMASTGDANGTLERLRRCVDVFEQYPGLCRSAIW